MHQDIVVLQFVDFVQYVEDDVVLVVEDLPEPLVVGGGTDSLVGDVDVRPVGAERAGDRLDSLRLGPVLSAVDVRVSRLDPLFFGRLDQTVGDVLRAE